MCITRIKSRTTLIDYSAFTRKGTHANEPTLSTFLSSRSQYSIHTILLSRYPCNLEVMFTRCISCDIYLLTPLHLREFSSRCGIFKVYWEIWDTGLLLPTYIIERSKIKFWRSTEYWKIFFIATLQFQVCLIVLFNNNRNFSEHSEILRNLIRHR